MAGKQMVDVVKMYRALKQLGHRRIWLRIVSSDDLYMVTFESRALARYNHKHNTWRFMKNADSVDDYPLGKEPDGEGLTELHEKDDGELLTNLELREGDIDLIRTYLATLND